MGHIKNSLEELKKVTVPPFNEVVATTLNVVVFMFVVAFLIFLMDFILGMQQVSFLGYSWKGVLGTIYALF